MTRLSHPVGRLPKLATGALCIPSHLEPYSCFRREQPRRYAKAMDFSTSSLPFGNSAVALYLARGRAWRNRCVRTQARTIDFCLETAEIQYGPPTRQSKR